MVSAVVWGPVSEWVSGAATFAAVVVALVFSLRQERSQREVALASVYAWFELRKSDAKADPGGVLWLVNNTQSPIYDWKVTVAWPGPGDSPVRLDTGQAEHGLLPPGRHEFFLRASQSTPLPSNDAVVAVTLRFTDASGRKRTRESVLPTPAGRGSP